MIQENTSLPRVLLLAHSCHPEIGSEPALGWNRALETAKKYATWVLCDEHYNRAAIERYLSRHGEIENLTFVFVPANRLEQRLARWPGMFYPSYNLWHRRAYQIAKELHSRINFDVVHQVNLCGFREPGYLWKLEAPFIWGPIGGAQNYPWRFLSSAGLAGAAKETVRNLLNSWQMRFALRVGKAARAAKVLMAANSTNAAEMQRRRGKPVEVMCETGVHTLQQPPMRDFRHEGPLRLLWSGVFEHRKALHLLLEALSKLPESVPFELRILGRGEMENRWRNIAQRLKIDRHCTWLGWLDHAEVVKQYLWADAFVFSSLRDTTGNVVLESFAAGTPVLCLDHQGMVDIVTPKCGVKLPVTTPGEVVVGMRDTLARWYANRDELERLSRGALERAEYYSWRRQGERMVNVYEAVLRNEAHAVESATDVAHSPTPNRGSNRSANEKALAGL
jgi:glycosyltransferase involved in cell wall biosynthesis